MFLGGWSIGIPWELTDLFGTTLHMGTAGVVLGNVINVVVFVAKGWILVFIMMWVRWTLPRLRIDQVMMMCLKYLIPISCILLLGVSVWTLLMPALAQTIISFIIFVVSVAGLIWGLIKVVTLSMAPPGTGMPGMWRTTGLPGYQGAERPT
jgi:NADH-quinone oxidoreductase subunit H